MWNFPKDLRYHGLLAEEAYALRNATEFHLAMKLPFQAHREHNTYTDRSFVLVHVTSAIDLPIGTPLYFPGVPLDIFRLPRREIHGTHSCYPNTINCGTPWPTPVNAPEHPDTPDEWLIAFSDQTNKDPK